MRNVINILILLLLLPATCFSQEKVISRIPILQHPYYGPNVLPALKELVTQSGESTSNHFCVGRVEVLEGGHESVLVYWKENRALVLWEPGRGLNLRGIPDPRYDLKHSRRYWDLDEHVVPTLAGIGGSSFLISREHAREWLRKCEQTGEQFVINLKAPANKRVQRPTAR